MESVHEAAPVGNEDRDPLFDRPSALEIDRAADARLVHIARGRAVMSRPVFGVIGYGFIKLGCEPAPLLLGLILGPMMEENLRRALLLSRGDWGVLVTRPISAGLLVAAAVLVVIAARRGSVRPTSNCSLRAQGHVDGGFRAQTRSASVRGKLRP